MDCMGYQTLLKAVFAYPVNFICLLRVKGTTEWVL